MLAWCMSRKFCGQGEATKANIAEQKRTGRSPGEAPWAWVLQARALPSLVGCGTPAARAKGALPGEQLCCAYGLACPPVGVCIPQAAEKPLPACSLGGGRVLSLLRRLCVLCEAELSVLVSWAWQMLRVLAFYVAGRCSAFSNIGKGCSRQKRGPL